jgi:hypothetical protein
MAIFLKLLHVRTVSKTQITSKEEDNTKTVEGYGTRREGKK